MSSNDTEKLSVALYKIRDDNGCFILVNQEIVYDDMRAPSPIGLYFDELDIVCWTTLTATTTFIGALSKTPMRCPDAVFNDLGRIAPSRLP